MASVKVYNDNFEKAMRKFKKQVMAEGIIQEVREREHFMKPSEKRNRAKKAARNRWLKKLRDESKPGKDF